MDDIIPKQCGKQKIPALLCTGIFIVNIGSAVILMEIRMNIQYSIQNIQLSFFIHNHHIITSSHLHILTSSHLHISTLAHLHITTSSHPHISTSSHFLNRDYIFRAHGNCIFVKRKQLMISFRQRFFQTFHHIL